jgi:hypothetical protein
MVITLGCCLRYKGSIPFGVSGERGEPRGRLRGYNTMDSMARLHRAYPSSILGDSIKILMSIDSAPVS